MTYQEKLKDPRWREKRLEILTRDNYICQECDRTWRELHVHHKYYKRNTEPWDYDNGVLVTLCDNCHRQIHYFLYDLDKDQNAIFKAAYEEFYGVPCVFFKCI